MAALAEVAAEALETDSAATAEAKGVDVGQLADSLGKGLKEVAGLAVSIYSLIRSDKNLKDQDENFKRKRYLAGIVWKGESRNSLINDGLIPSYYSTSEIKEKLARGVLPYGWSAQTTVQQGFGSEVRAVTLLKTIKDESVEAAALAAIRRERRGDVEAVNSFARKLATAKSIEQLKSHLI